MLGMTPQKQKQKQKQRQEQEAVWALLPRLSPKGIGAKLGHLIMGKKGTRSSGAERFWRWSSGFWFLRGAEVLLWACHDSVYDRG